jgi:hypothetical protein
MVEFIVIRGSNDRVTSEAQVDEFDDANEAVMTYAQFLLAMGYATESVRDALEQVAGEL